MIQEKDFLYRVPVKNALVTTPGQQTRNPEILVDLEGGEFMHGNILDANSTNKLINQSVKDAVDNKLIESGHVTQDLLDAETTRATEQENSLKTLIGAETSARTKGDESLSAKIKAEQTRAEGKEKEISDKLAIVDGDSNTEGSFRKAIADVIAAAPEDLDTLKEIADKLADNDDLHTALNQAITNKADASALLNEVARATGAESALQAAIDTKQPKGNYLTEHQSLEEYAKKTDIPEIDTSDFVSKTATDNQIIRSLLSVKNTLLVYGDILASGNRDCSIKICNSTDSRTYSALGYNFVSVRDSTAEMRNTSDSITSFKLDRSEPTGLGDAIFSLSGNGVRLLNGDNNHVLTSNASTIDITQYALKSQLDTKADTTALTTLEQKVTANTTAIEGKQDKGNYMEYSSKDDDGYTIDCELNTSEPITVDGGSGYKTYVSQSGIHTLDDNSERKSSLSITELSIDSSPTIRTRYTVDGITTTQYNDCLATSDGTFKPISDFVLKTELPTIPTKTSELTNDSKFVNISQLSEYVAFQVNNVKVALEKNIAKKQDKITVNGVDVTNLETADITQLRAIVKDLLTALSNSGLIREQLGLE